MTSCLQKAITFIQYCIMYIAMFDVSEIVKHSHVNSEAELWLGTICLDTVSELHIWLNI